ncbi:MAG TPA: diacylglycerol kinase family protein [Kofleriaceae bacterium]|nr:diacylglycerol kinase family protein [Kofleriaceae bacterium]
MARRVAVMLNRRAQGATPARLRWFRDHVPGGDLFVPDSVADTRAALSTIVARDYDVLCAGGGDGTFMLAAATLVALAPSRMPALLPLRLGTGNAVHDLCGASPPTPRGLTHDLARAADPTEAPAPLRLLDIDGQLTHFAGVGLDADWAADYAWLVKRHLGAGRLLPVVRGAPGYALTALALTLPRLLRRPFVRIRIVAVGAAARLDANGQPTQPFADGDMLFDGLATMASASTVPSYSAGLPYFRHVDRIGDAFELKIAFASPYDVLRHARRVLAGEPDPARIHDFSAHAVRIELATPARYHVGGDVLPAAHAFTIRASGHAVPILRGMQRG